MSGGSMDYICYKIEEYANDLEDKELIELAKDFAKVFHDAEWYHSGDYSEGTYNQSIIEFKEKWLRNDGTERLKELINKTIDETKTNLLNMIGEGKYCKDCKNFSCLEADSYGHCKIKTSCLAHRYENVCENFEAL